MPTKTKAKAKAQEEKPVLKFGLQAHGVIRIFSKDKEVAVKGKKVTITDFWTNVSRKVEDGVYENVNLKVSFPMDHETPEHNEIIEVKEGFLTVTGEGEYALMKMVIMSWDYTEA